MHSPVIDFIFTTVTKMVNGNGKLSANQENLSCSVQMSHTAQLIQEIGMCDLFGYPEHGRELKSNNDLVVGNKMALLGGDFFMGKMWIRNSLLRFEYSYEKFI